MKSATIELVGGPLDGITLPRTRYFKEGNYEAVNTLNLATPENGWSAESVYKTQGGKLVYDAEATKERKAITDADPSLLD